VIADEGDVPRWSEDAEFFDSPLLPFGTSERSLFPDGWEGDLAPVDYESSDAEQTGHAVSAPPAAPGLDGAALDAFVALSAQRPPAKGSRRSFGRRRQ
jgi:hypothetical protein